MSEQHGASLADTAADSWLTPTAASIAGFTLAVLSMLNDGSWVLALDTFVSRDGSGSFHDTVIAVGVVQGLLAIAALILAKRGLASPDATARNVGGATAILGVLGVGFAFLSIASGLFAAM
ncbi:hypothetical protein [Nocardioides ochotonae]|uniref:hypothetical protein n=1 Tax=Nocardioides ochotonae TaxID=2685869 RepID=UPI00140C15C0|nr:hypothetical protein [Nocardioides ochotonae]